nr:hypothetical protein [Escherichia coli]
MSDMHLDYGYAGTAHRAQGASEAFVIAPAGATYARQRLALSVMRMWRSQE